MSVQTTTMMTKSAIIPYLLRVVSKCEVHDVNRAANAVSGASASAGRWSVPGSQAELVSGFRTEKRCVSAPENALQTATDRTQNLHEPQHIGVLGEQAGRIETAPFQQLGRMHVQALKPSGIGDHPMRDPSKAPDNQPAADADCEQGDGSSD